MSSQNFVLYNLLIVDNLQIVVNLQIVPSKTLAIATNYVIFL